MARIISLTVRNFRGIKDLSIDFSDENLICFIGRGDSGKTSILDAISSVLSSSWNLTFYDTDFYNCVLDEPIEITASLIDFPDKLLSEQKYGLHIRSLNTDTNVINDEMPVDELVDVIKPVITIKLSVDRSLEPKWIVTNSREQEDKQINATDRASLSCYMVSDYIDRHFSSNKGSPLNSLLKKQDAKDVASESNAIIDSLRQAKTEIDDFPFTELEEVTNIIKNKAAVFGLDISDTHTTLDIKELATKKGQISLHENTIPFRLKGKGSKRLASFAIQSALGDSGGIMLVDEIEQGLEPDRIKQLVRTLKEQQPSQIFLTTHSREVVTELNSSSLLLILKENNGSKIESRRLSTDGDRLQKAVRACPEAFFAKKVIVCEGATEIGICRAIDKWRISLGKEQMSFKDCAYVDGTGNTLVDRTREIQQVGISTALFCDSDDPKVNADKDSLKETGVSIFDCEIDKCIEQQFFADLPWDAVKTLLKYVYECSPASFITAFSEQTSVPVDQWVDNEELRCKIVSEFKTKPNGNAGKKWFKGVHHGEILGDVAFEYMNKIAVTSHLSKSLKALTDWIDS